MLDFQKLMVQIKSVAGSDVDKLGSFVETLEAASLAYQSASQEPKALLSRIAENESLLLWPVAHPLEDFGLVKKVDDTVPDITVAAVDGSQIMPSQHEVHNCFLLNIGFVQLCYGTNEKPILQSFPHLYHRPDELYPLVNRRRLHIDELYVALERNLLELKYLTERSIAAQEKGLQVVALLDGSLIPWSAEKMPLHYQEYFFDELKTLLKALELKKIPLVGYISHSRSSEVINILRAFKCPYDTSDCRTHCRDLNEEDFPCSSVWPLADRLLLQNVLEPGERSGIFLSSASATKFLPEQEQICFAYLNVGAEVARLEFPKWLAHASRERDIAFGAILSQTNKGKGYPVALAEAHHLAVIRGHDRQQFFELLKQHLVAKGIGKVRLSPKESKKRIGLV
jgi:hypothetical protein